MRKMLYLAICLVLILSCFCSCTEKSTETVMYCYKTKIYCTHNTICKGTENWSLRDEKFIATACDIDMIDLTTDHFYPHYHYIVTKQVIDN